MNIILVDSGIREDLLPFTFTRPVSEIRIGILTIREKWEKRLNSKASWLTAPYLSTKYPLKSADQNLLINAGICPNEQLVNEIENLKPGQTLISGDLIIAQVQAGSANAWANDTENIAYKGELTLIDRVWKIFQHNGGELEQDFDLITKGRKSAVLSSTNTILGDRIFVEEGVEAECAVFNTLSGPIYLAKDSTVMEGTVIRGGLSLGEHSQLKLGAKIYGATTIGPWCKVGGEVNNSVIFGYSNKGHDGFLGNSVLGEWCNIGADSNNSNLKNNYDEIRVWNYSKKGFERTGLQFCGLMMGDHSKCGINTMFNTGTVAGVMCNIYGGGFPRTYIPSYSWGGAAGYSVYKFNKAMETAKRVMERRNVELDNIEEDILRHVYENTAEWADSL